MDLATNLTLAMNATGTKLVGTTTAKDPLVVNIVDELTDGTGTDKADQSWHDRRTLASTGTDAIYLYGVMGDAFGDTVNFTKIKMLLVSLAGKAESGYELYIGGHARQWDSWQTTGSAGGKEKLQGGGVLAKWQPGTVGFPVTYLTDDVIRIENAGANSVAYDIVLIGEQGG